MTNATALGVVIRSMAVDVEVDFDRPKHLDRGFFHEPTVFANVDNSSTIAREEIFGPVLTVIPAEDEEDANDTIYGLNASAFTNDVDRARHVARQLRSPPVAGTAPSSIPSAM